MDLLMFQHVLDNTILSSWEFMKISGNWTAFTH